jgi:hypothetical protein
MQAFKQFTTFIISICFVAVSFADNFDIELTLDSEISYESQKIFINSLKGIQSKRDLEKLIKNQDWIDEYYLNFIPISKSAKLSITSRKPFFILNNRYFVDRELKKFKFFNSDLNLVLVSGPIDDLNDPLKIMNFFNDYEKKFFNLKTIEYSYVSGWEVTTNSFVVKIGKQLSEKKFKSLRDTLNYLYENKRNPSMIDLRYKDGVALNYGE